MTEFQRDFETIIIETGMTGTQFKFNMKYFKRIADRNVSEATPNVRAYNACKRNRINTVDELVDRWDDINKFRGVGNLTVKEIKNGVLNLYYSTLTTEERKEFWKENLG